MGSIKKSAKNKFKALRKAVSMDKGIDGIGAEGQPKSRTKKDQRRRKDFLDYFLKRNQNRKQKRQVNLGTVF